MKKLITSLALVLSALSSYAITPLWMRDARISPDGSEIVFCYKGDIYKVPAQGGTAVQLTTQTSYEANPVWSPDGKQIAFASDRNGNFDLFIMPADGGAARRRIYGLPLPHGGDGSPAPEAQAAFSQACRGVWMATRPRPGRRLPFPPPQAPLSGT